MKRVPEHRPAHEHRGHLADADADPDSDQAPGEGAGSATAVIHVGKLHFASEQAVVERILGARPGVFGVDADPVAQTATVCFDPPVSSCPVTSATPPAHLDGGAPRHDHTAVERDECAHGGGHGGHAGRSVAAMGRDVRNRSLVAATVAVAVPIAVWSPLGKSLFGSIPGTPFGLRADIVRMRSDPLDIATAVAIEQGSLGARPVP